MCYSKASVRHSMLAKVFCKEGDTWGWLKIVSDFKKRRFPWEFLGQIFLPEGCSYHNAPQYLGLWAVVLSVFFDPLLLLHTRLSKSLVSFTLLLHARQCPSSAQEPCHHSNTLFNFLQSDVISLVWCPLFKTSHQRR